MKIRRHTIFLFIIIACFALGSIRFDIQRVFRINRILMPGTQFGDIAPFDSVQVCKPCHEEIYNDWQGSIHAHQARDPMNIALRAIIVKYDILRGDWCIRCHEPTPWLEGRCQPNGEEFERKDYFELNCDFCHLMVDPVYPDSTIRIDPQLGAPRGYGNAQYVLQRYPNPKRGPRGDTTSAHGVVADTFQRKSEHCGVCHDASNPFVFDPLTVKIVDAPHTYGAAQRTYSEWLLSDFAKMGDSGTCQACHMTRQPGYSSTYTYRTDVAKHDLTGGNVFIPDILPLFPEFASDIDTVELRKGKERSIAILRTAAKLDVSAGIEGDSVTATVRVTNLTGHKLPTGVSSRRMWVNLVGLNANGDTIYEDGKYDFQNAVFISTPKMLYRLTAGMTKRTADWFGLNPGPSGLAGINDTIYFDNRIPPKGFNNARFKERLAEPVGYYYADGQYWDEASYRLPKSVTKVKATLYYLVVTRQTIEWLRNQNLGNEFDRYNMGQRLYDAYFATGKAPPVIMNEVSVDVGETFIPLDPVYNPALPSRYQLEQNYPNPFNSSTIINYQLPIASYVTLKIYNTQGQEIKTLIDGIQDSGYKSVEWNSTNNNGNLVSSGVYFYQLDATSVIKPITSFKQIRKMVIMK